MATVKITIHVKDAPDNKVEIDAFTTSCGSLMIHPGYKEEGWTITHYPSGLGLVHHLRTKALANELAKALAEIPGWETVTKATAGKFYKKHHSILHILLNLGEDYDG